jgi:hypothetical protein
MLSPHIMDERRPSAAHAVTRRLRRALLLRMLCLALAMPALGAAGPALEYGPEAEAGFLVRCAGPDQASPEAASCRREMERLQAALGYEAFLERASGGPGAFTLAARSSLVTAAATSAAPR